MARIKGRAAELLALASLAVAAVLLPGGVAAAGGECGKVSCSMGSCVESGDYAFGFACTIDYKCQGGSSSPAPAPSPPAELPPPTNFTIFDPCLMQYCGDGGACEKASEFTHRCACQDGYTNLLNDTSYPCYRQCSLGSDCKGLGIVVMDGSTPTSSPPGAGALLHHPVKNSGSGAVAAPADRLLQLLLLMVSFLWLMAI